MIGSDPQDHPLYEPLKSWIAERLELPADALHPQVVQQVGDEILREYGGFASIDGTVECRTDTERISYQIDVEDATLSLSRDEFVERASKEVEPLQQQGTQII